MIRSRTSFGASSFSPPLSPAASSANLLDCSPNSMKKVGPAVGTRTWRMLLIVLFVATVMYIISLLLFAPSNKPNVMNARLTDKVTIVMNTFKRHSLMQDAIDFYGTCGTVKNIHIIWSEKDPPPINILNRYKDRQHPQVIFVQHPVDSLNNRFKPLEGPHTDAIFSVDDDIRVSCEDLTLAYEVWSASSRSIVGFMPRLHLRGKDDKLIYRCWWRVWLHGAYSVILTKAAFLHHDYFKMYTNEMPSSIRELVDTERNCEDIAMQFLISDRSNLAPIYVKGSLQDLGLLNGISTSKTIITAGHMDRRTACLNLLVDLYGHNPLIRSHQIVYSAANSWANAPSTWAEYVSSDLWKL